MNSGGPSVLILGAGINGCALARELALNGVSAWLVDVADVAAGATAGSSHLIHGGLRYLEYGEFDLVKESLAERGRLLRLAPQFVHPLRLWIPSSNRFGGVNMAISRFFGWDWWPAHQPRGGRGVSLVRAGLALYDAYARDPSVPKHRVTRVGATGAPRVNAHAYRWVSSYYDAQVAYPERLLLAIVDDAARISSEAGLDFRLFTHHGARLRGKTAEVFSPCDAASTVATCTPQIVVNATGAWVDETLARLDVSSGRLMGGTKGTHLFTFNARLRELLGHDGIYAEARDGRPIFITPLAGCVLIGTTDERFEGPPQNATATDRELDYLIESVNTIVPDAPLSRDDVDFHYAAVRPLPYANSATTAAITRRHALVANDSAAVPLVSLVGGKLTTMRSLAETAAAAILERLGRQSVANSRERLIPGAEDYPHDDGEVAAAWQRIGERLGYSAHSVAAVWRLCGTRTESILSTDADRTLLGETLLPCAFARWSIRHEQARTLADLVERRLMLLYDQQLTRSCLDRLAQLLVEAGQLSSAQAMAAVNDLVARLAARYGKRVESLV